MSLSSWLDSLGLSEYLHNFLHSGYNTLEAVRNLWELEIVNVSIYIYTHTQCFFGYIIGFELRR